MNSRLSATDPKVEGQIGLGAGHTPRSKRRVEHFQRLIRRQSSENYVHPALKRRLAYRRPLIPRHRSLASTEHARLLALAQRIKRRTLRYEPLPRVPPFYCNKCGLSSRRLSLLINHVCSKKMPVSMDRVTLDRLVQLGSRSRAKDAHGLMERAHHPQLLTIQRTPSTFHFNVLGSRLHKPFRLSELAFRAVQAAHLQFDSIVEINKAGPSSPHEALHENEQMILSADGLGSYCPSCAHLFPSFLSYDNHLRRAKHCARKLRDPLTVEVSRTVAYPVDGMRIPVEAGDDEWWSCSNCSRQDFKTLADFHSHLFDCALT